MKTPDRTPMVIKMADGTEKYIGVFLNKEGVYEKYVYRSKHLYVIIDYGGISEEEGSGWLIDSDVYESFISSCCHTIRVIDEENHVTYEVSVKKFNDYATRIFTKNVKTKAERMQKVLELVHWNIVE